MRKDIKKVALIKTDYEEGRLQPTQLATPWVNYSLLVLKYFSLSNIPDLKPKKVIVPRTSIIAIWHRLALPKNE
jgi:hypothetical protein